MLEEIQITVFILNVVMKKLVNYGW